jgi:hypothetical protein
MKDNVYTLPRIGLTKTPISWWDNSSLGPVIWQLPAGLGCCLLAHSPALLAQLGTSLWGSPVYSHFTYTLSQETSL